MGQPTNESDYQWLQVFRNELSGACKSPWALEGLLPWMERSLPDLSRFEYSLDTNWCGPSRIKLVTFWRRPWRVVNNGGSPHYRDRLSLHVYMEDGALRVTCAELPLKPNPAPLLIQKPEADPVQYILKCLLAHCRRVQRIVAELDGVLHNERNSLAHDQRMSYALEYLKRNHSDFRRMAQLYHFIRKQLEGHNEFSPVPELIPEPDSVPA